ncbi:MAG: ATP-binding cassette domain-containing protein [Propionibacteriales bacterium]|nr:ATP-binding cassette domain-containing protein [Propionibacteriales bacterium]
MTGPQSETASVSGPEAVGSPTLLEVTGLTKHFPVGKKTTVRAVDGVDLEIREGETLGVVGESGCGKSTTARLILRLLRPTAGTIRFEGSDIGAAQERELHTIRRDMQAVFQDSFSSLDPRMTVAQSVAEPLVAHRVGNAKERRERIDELLDVVGLAREFATRYPHQLSGGQRQRVGIARALALQPKLVVLDEPVSALDLSVQAQIVNLLVDLQERFGLAYIFIAHDLGVVRQISHRVAIMYLGRVVETGPTDDIFTTPAHPYTRALLSATLNPDPEIERNRQRILLTGDPPSPMRMPEGCRFHPRCPRAEARCSQEDPQLRERGQDRPVACFFPHDDTFDFGRGVSAE